MAVLWVDDDAKRLSGWCDMLTKAGYEVLFAEDPDEALTITQKNLDDIEQVIIDIMLPTGRTYANENTNYGMNTGYLLARSIHDLLPDARILLLTNKPEDDVRQEMPQDFSMTLMVKTHTGPSRIVAWLRG